MNAARRTLLLLVVLLVIASPVPGSAQRVGENATRSAQDAFGTSIAGEAVGLYDSNQVRGFSPVTAGNVRIEGLYFDQVWRLSARLRRTATVYVGLAAIDTPFLAPTGVVDYAFRKPGPSASASTYWAVNSYWGVDGEVDAVVPLRRDVLSLGVGVGLYRSVFFDGAASFNHVESVSLRWTPSSRVEVIPFWSRSRISGLEVSPIYVSRDGALPGDIPSNRFPGPAWAQFNQTALNHGVIVSWSPERRSQLRLGVFRSLFDDQDRFTNLISIGAGQPPRQTIIADPRSKSLSTSGEARFSRSFDDGSRRHTLYLSLRGRDRMIEYGGSQVVDLGLPGGEDARGPAPPLQFTRGSVDRVRQLTAGVAYDLRWRGLGQINLALQRTGYSKEVQLPSAPRRETNTNEWLYNLMAVAELRSNLAAYASHISGLEESGVAPDIAANRQEPLAAIRTTQIDAGIRWTIRPRLNFLVGVFDLRKPYYNLDAANRFVILGDVRHRGVELSFSGQLLASVRVVAGALLLKARVSGEAVALGRSGPRPVNQPARIYRANVDWQPGFLRGWSFDFGVGHSSARAATLDNRVTLPGRTTLDAGFRYRLNLGSNPAVVRGLITNLFDAQGFELRGSGAFRPLAGRSASLSLAVDY